MTILLRWEQVHAYRLARQHLSAHADAADMLAVVSDVGGLHAQLMQAAELSLWARAAGLARDAVQAALWRERTLVKTWAMRGTLHLLTAEDYPMFVAARAATPLRRPPSWYSYHGLTPEDEHAILTAIPSVLSNKPQTREQLADAVVQHTGNAKLRELLLSGWGALLKPSAFRGELCFGPNQGQNVTFVRPDQWLRKWQAVEPETAPHAYVRRFLTTYGPATLDEFARWWGTDASHARRIFKTLSKELSEVEVEGWKAWVLTSTLPQIHESSLSPVVRLLPHFDSYTLAVARHSDALLPAAHKGRVYRPQGWISPVVLVDGRIAGVWERNERGSMVTISLELFEPKSEGMLHGLAAEAKRLSEYLGIAVQL